MSTIAMKDSSQMRHGCIADRSQLYQDIASGPFFGAKRPGAKKNATRKIYPGAPHGLADTHKDQLNADPLAILKA